MTLLYQIYLLPYQVPLFFTDMYITLQLSTTTVIWLSQTACLLSMASYTCVQHYQYPSDCSPSPFDNEKWRNDYVGKFCVSSTTLLNFRNVQMSYENHCWNKETNQKTLKKAAFSSFIGQKRVFCSNFHPSNNIDQIYFGLIYQRKSRAHVTFKSCLLLLGQT